ncbi:MAG: TAT-variant-translocated molybdopterin oxidoreductase [Gemmatimonadaceae bacterium]
MMHSGEPDRSMRLSARSGQEWCRSLNEIMCDDAVRESLAREFPAGAAEWNDGISRRSFVKLLGASMALAGLGGCVREPAEKIMPYINDPADLVPGNALHYATSMTIDGYATGLLVESHIGRPTKVEGNPDHPASLGAAGVYEQASILQLYDPHRARAARLAGRKATWNELARALSPGLLHTRVGARGAGLRLLLEPTSSPLTVMVLSRVATEYPDARVYFHAPLAAMVSRDTSRSIPGTALDTALHTALVPQFDFSRAAVVVSLDADFLSSMPFHLRYAHDFAAQRRGMIAAQSSNRLYVAEPAPTPTGTLADYRLAASPASVAGVAAALSEAVEIITHAQNAQNNVLRDVPRVAAAMPISAAAQAWVDAAARDLVAHMGRGIVIAGPRQPAVVHALALAINTSLGNTGRTVWFTRNPVWQAGAPTHELSGLQAEIASGQVDTLLILGGNPAYNAPADLQFDRVLRSVPNTVYLSEYENETARAAASFVPASHYLESWGDARAYDGTISRVQPLIAPLDGGKTRDELLAVVAGMGTVSAHDLARESSRASHAGAGPFDAWWDETLRRGIVEGSALARTSAAPARNTIGAPAAGVAPAGGSAPSRSAGDANSIELVFAPSAAVFDGRFADNAWLQELPDPITKLTWDNAALLSPALAARIGVASGDVITVRARGRSLDVPALIVPGHADATVTLPLGYGRAGAEAVARGVGVNAYMLRSSDAPYVEAGVVLARTGRTHQLAVTQTHWTLEGRDIVHEVAVSDLARVPGAEHASATPPRQSPRHPLTLYEPPAPSAAGFGRDQWAMTIDLSLCTGCSACVVACQAENNVPVVGKAGVLQSREMQWLRIDRYYEGVAEAPRMISQPMLCQHCEKAPCEYVCPVEATVHSDDGLNEMVYNRCVGTRFCSNNCPYKVRRFNWFDYTSELAETERMAMNPEVSVRARGVMEKCTFCVQRLRRTQIDSELSGAPRTGPVMTACQQTCPTQAIVFGSLTDPNSDVTRLRDDPRSYAVLDELGTVPRVHYLARVTSAATPTTPTTPIEQTPSSLGPGDQPPS